MFHGCNAALVLLIILHKHFDKLLIQITMSLVQIQRELHVDNGVGVAYEYFYVKYFNSTNTVKI